MLLCIIIVRVVIKKNRLSLNLVSNDSYTYRVQMIDRSTQPIDVAAHLALLGESLGIIGQRLKEHQVS